MQPGTAALRLVLLFGVALLAVGVGFTAGSSVPGSAPNQSALAGPNLTLTSLQQEFFDNLNDRRFCIPGTTPGLEVVAYDHDDGSVVEVASPGFWRSLFKNVTSGLTGVAVGAIFSGVTGGIGVAVAGVVASEVAVTVAQHVNEGGSVVEDAIVYNHITVDGVGDVLPDVLDLALANVTDTSALTGWSSDHEISFVDGGVLSGRLVDDGGAEVTSILGVDIFVISNAQAPEADRYLFGAVVYNDPIASGRPVALGDLLDLDLGSALDGVPEGTEGSYQATMFALSPSFPSTTSGTECPVSVGGVAELPASEDATLDATGASDVNIGVLVGVVAVAVIVGATGLGGIAWYLKRRVG